MMVASFRFHTTDIQYDARQCLAPGWLIRPDLNENVYIYILGHLVAALIQKCFNISKHYHTIAEENNCLITQA